MMQLFGKPCSTNINLQEIPLYSATKYSHLRWLLMTLAIGKKTEIRTEAMLNIFCRSECSLTSLRDDSFTDDWYRMRWKLVSPQTAMCIDMVSRNRVLLP